LACRIIEQSMTVAEVAKLLAAIAATKLDTIVGHIEWGTKNLPRFAQRNIAKTPLVCGQWRLQEGAKYDILIADNRTAPEIPVSGKMHPIA
jgi:branched-chain amino acid transport system substrate-binding protein